jgi:hypothetical protein
MLIGGEVGAEAMAWTGNPWLIAGGAVIGIKHNAIMQNSYIIFDTDCIEWLYLRG